MARAACFLISCRDRHYHCHKFRYERDGIILGLDLSDFCLRNSLEGFTHLLYRPSYCIAL